MSEILRHVHTTRLRLSVATSGLYGIQCKCSMVRLRLWLELFFSEIHKVGNLGIFVFLKIENKAEIDHILKGRVQRRLQENNRNFTECSHF